MHADYYSLNILVFFLILFVLCRSLNNYIHLYKTLKLSNKCYSLGKRNRVSKGSKKLYTCKHLNYLFTMIIY